MNNKNIYLLIVGILCAALICAVLIGLVGGFWTGNDNNEQPGESTVNTTEAEPSKETQQAPTGDGDIDEPIDGTRPEIPTVTTGNGEEEDPTTGKTPEQTTGKDNDDKDDDDDSDITIDLIPEPSEGEGSSEKPVESTTPTDSKIEIDFNDF